MEPRPTHLPLVAGCRAVLVLRAERDVEHRRRSLPAHDLAGVVRQLGSPRVVVEVLVIPRQRAVRARPVPRREPAGPADRLDAIAWLSLSANGLVLLEPPGADDLHARPGREWSRLLGRVRHRLRRLARHAETGGRAA